MWGIVVTLVSLWSRDIQYVGINFNPCHCHAFYYLAGVHEHNLFNPSLHSLFVHLFVWL